MKFREAKLLKRFAMQNANPDQYGQVLFGLPNRLEMRVSTRLRPDRINIMESLILAQNERWRRVLSMQVERQGEACFPRERRTGE